MSKDLTKKLEGQPNGRFDELFQMVQTIRAELSDLKQTVEVRLYDTRPIWEKVQLDIAGLQTDIAGLKEGQKDLTQGQLSLSEGQLRVTEGQLRLTEGQLSLVEGQKSLIEEQKGLVEGQKSLVEGQRRLEEGLEALRGEMRTGFRGFTRKISVLNDDVLEVRANYKDLAERVCKLETESVTENP